MKKSKYIKKSYVSPCNILFLGTIFVVIYEPNVMNIFKNIINSIETCIH